MYSMVLQSLLTLCRVNRSVGNELLLNRSRWSKAVINFGEEDLEEK